MNIENYPFEARLIDWNKALEMEINDFPSTDDGTWWVLRQVGYVKERVYPLVDPGLIPIVGRMLDLPILTISCCSGHPNEKTRSGNFMSHIEFVFRKSAFGKQFIEVYKEVFEGERKWRLCGGSAMTLISIDGFGVTLPLRFCTEKCLPITTSWRGIRTISGVQDAWERFSSVLNLFDGKGLYRPPLDMLSAKAASEAVSSSDLFRDEFMEALQKASFMNS